MPPRFESFGHDKLTAKHCYFRCLRPDVDGIKIFDKDDQLQVVKHCFYLNVLWPGNLYQKF